jgi:LemA protein
VSKTAKRKMSKSAIWFGGIVGFIFIAGLWFSGNYNSLISARNQVKLAWGTVETSYQKRFDLIDNLVQSAKSGQTQESKIYVAIADSRKMYNSATNESGKAAAINAMETNIAMLPRLQEAQYPDLKSQKLVEGLMNDLRGTETEIQSVRNAYNKTATNYNTNISSFPKNFFATAFNFKEVTLFKSDTGASSAVKVKF